MILLQLVANGTDLTTRKNSNVYSKKLFIDEESLEDYKEEFYGICTNPIEGFVTQLDSNEPVDMSTIELEFEEGN
jgi:hypothetical protein